MKKIIMLMSCVIYIIVAFYSYNSFKAQNIDNITYQKYTKVLISKWGNENSILEKNKEIESYAIEKKINIIKVNYEPTDNIENHTINLYCAIGNKDEFKNDLVKIFNISNLNFKKFSETGFLANKETDNKNQIGTIKTFYNDGLVKITSINNSNSIVGKYLFSCEKNIDNFISQMNFEKQSSNTARILTNSTMDNIIIVVFILFLLMYFVTYIYFLIVNYKKIAIHKMIGWDNFSIIKNVLLKDILILHFISCIVVSILLTIRILLYNNGNQFFEFIMFYLKNEILTMVIVLSLSAIFFGTVKYIDIKLMIADKKLVKIPQILNFLFKFILIIVISIILLYLSNNLVIYINSRNNVKKINTTNNYAIYNLNSMYAITSDLELMAETSQKLQKLFENENQNDCILSYLEKSSNTLDGYNNVLYINSEYLNKNKIYDVKNRRVLEKNEYGNYMTVLLPKKYSSNKDNIEKLCLDWYESQDNIEKYYSDANKKYIPQKFQKDKIKFIYINNNQKFFTYNVKTQYSHNPIVFIVNSKNVSTNKIFTLFSTGNIYTKVHEKNNLWNEKKETLKKYNLLEEIKSLELLYNKYNNYLHEINTQIKYFSIISVLIIASILLLIFFITVNYLERNKFIHVIKTLHGYMFFEKHFNYLIMNLILYLIIVNIFLILKNKLDVLVVNIPIQYTFVVIIVLSILYTIEVLFSCIFLKILETNKLKDVIKGV